MATAHDLAGDCMDKLVQNLCIPRIKSMRKSARRDLTKRYCLLSSLRIVDDSVQRTTLHLVTILSCALPFHKHISNKYPERKLVLEQSLSKHKCLSRYILFKLIYYMFNIHVVLLQYMPCCSNTAYLNVCGIAYHVCVWQNTVLLHTCSSDICCSLATSSSVLFFSLAAAAAMISFICFSVSISFCRASSSSSRETVYMHGQDSH